MIAETTTLDKWGYLVGIGLLMAIWTVLFLLRRDVHKRMLIMSIALIPLAPLGQYFFLQDYWRPPVILPIVIQGHLLGGAADLLFAFAMGGLATAAYPVLCHRFPIKVYKPERMWVILSFIGIEGGSMAILTQMLRINSIFASSIGFLLTALFIVAIRRDLLVDCIVSALISGVALAAAEGLLSFIVPLYLSRYWLLYHTSFGILIAGRVPLTEFIWGATFGAVTGVLVDAMQGSKLVNRKRALAQSKGADPSVI